jgi:nicotinamidase-related amidase
MSIAIIAFGLQKAYLHPQGSRYLGDKAEIYKIRILDYLRSLNRNDNKVYLIREVHQVDDQFYSKTKTHSIAGTKDVEIPDEYKPYIHFIVNTNRYNAFYKTALDSELYKIRPERVCILGFETHTNVLFTAEELRNRDYNVTLLEPLVTAEDEYLHSIALTMMVDFLSVDIKQE